MIRKLLLSASTWLRFVWTLLSLFRTKHVVNVQMTTIFVGRTYAVPLCNSTLNNFEKIVVMFTWASYRGRCFYVYTGILTPGTFTFIQAQIKIKTCTTHWLCRKNVHSLAKMESCRRNCACTRPARPQRIACSCDGWFYPSLLCSAGCLGIRGAPL